VTWRIWFALLCLWSFELAAVPAESTVGELLAERLALMRDVAAYKWHHDLPIEDLEREQRVLDNAVLSGLQYRLHADTTRQFFSLQITAAKAIQQHWHTRWQRGENAPDSPDLNHAVRPQLLLLGEYIVEQWAKDNGGDPEALAQRLGQVEGMPVALALAIAQAAASPRSYPDVARQVLDSGILRVGTTGDYAPFSLSADGDYRGSDIELARWLADQLRVSVVFVQTSWPTLMADHQRNRFDIALSGITETADRAQLARFSVPYYQDGKMALGRCEHSAQFNSLADIDQPEIRVIVNPGGTNQRFVNQHIKQATVRVFPDNRTIFDELVAARADIMITDHIEAQLQAARHPTLCVLNTGYLSTHRKAILMQADASLEALINKPLAIALREGLVRHWIDAALGVAY